MGANGFISKKDAKGFPQYTIIRGDEKFKNLKDNDMIDLTQIDDPYLLYGGNYFDDYKNNTKDFKYIKFDELPNLETNNSLMAQTLNEEIFNLYKGKDSASGNSFFNTIMTGIVTPDLRVGVTATDHNSYYEFNKLFFPIINKLHGYDAYEQNHISNLNWDSIISDFPADEMAMIESVNISAHRNFAGISFPCGMIASDRAIVENSLKKAFELFEADLAGKYYELGAVTEEEKKSLIEDDVFLHKPSAENFLTGAGGARSWPDNRGIFLNADKTFFCQVNAEDHCIFYSMQPGGNVLEAYDRLFRAMRVVEKTMKYVHDDTLGYVTTCPSKLGTGLKVSVIIKLPKLGKYLDELNHLFSKYQVTFRLREKDFNDDGVYILENKTTLGISESHTIENMINLMKVLIELEKESGKSISELLYLYPPQNSNLKSGFKPKKNSIEDSILILATNAFNSCKEELIQKMITLKKKECKTKCKSCKSIISETHFTCNECNNYFLCKICEENVIHPHNLLKKRNLN